MKLTRSVFASMADHTLLKPDATESDILELCKEADEIAVASVCVNGMWTSLATENLSSSSVKVCTVVGFPLGSTSISSVSYECRDAIENGADEIDAVIPLGLLKNGSLDLLTEYLVKVREASEDKTLKLILETATLTEEEIMLGCKLALKSNFDYVKTSTGFNAAGGATLESVKTMKKVVGDQMGIKASGGIKILADAQGMVDAGATRLGLSSTINIYRELPE